MLDALRLCRSAGLWLAGPLDRVAHLGHDLPPLWLRRHTGPVGNFERSASEFLGWIDRLGLLRDSDSVLDLGCGPGAMALELSRRESWRGAYVGFDVHAASIRWCRRRFRGDPRFGFELADLASPYGAGGRRIGEYRFPAKDGDIDLVLAKSLFTHLMEPEARHYLAEIRRVLRRGRPAFLTAFLFDPTSATGRGASPFFPVAGSDRRTRFRFHSRPESAVAYDRDLFTEMVEDARLRVLWLGPGFWPGDDLFPRGQDLLLIGH